jgi:plastocyanin
VQGLKSFLSLRRFSLFAATVGACAIAVGVVTGAGAAPSGASCGYGSPVSPSFVYDPTAPKVGDTVTFTSTSTSPNGVTNEAWDLNGDFDPQNPDPTKLDAVGHSVTYTFGAPGDHVVTLSASDVCGTKYAQRTVHVEPQPQTTPPPGGTPGTPGTPDSTAPVLGSLGLSTTVFRAARSGGPVSAAARPIGTKVSFSLSEAGAVKFTVQRKTLGRRVGTRCKAQTEANRKHRACTRWVSMKGSFTVTGKTGTNRFKFRGRIGGRSLKPGGYRLNGQARDQAGNRSKVKRTSFRIVR